MNLHARLIIVLDRSSLARLSEILQYTKSDPETVLYEYQEHHA